MKPTKFKLPYKSFRKDLSSVLDLKAVVVSFFGKSPFNLSSCKAGLVDNFLYQSIFIPSVLDDPVVDSETLCEIEGYYNSKQNVLYLHLCGIFDTHTLVKQYERLAVDLEEKGFLSVWAQLKHGYARSLLFLFSVSHILVITHPSQGFDISYIHLFRALDNVRLKLQTCISETLGKIPGVNSDWAYNGRLCSPRVLFLFQACPSAFRKKPEDGRNVNIKKLEHALEDQIYHILRKSRIITNISSNSLFAIPANQEFVFVEVEQEVTYDWTPFLVNSLVDLCKNNTSNTELNHCSFGYESLNIVKESKSSNTEHSFQKFLQQHIDQALLRGFDDNVGRHLPSNPYFVIPTVGVWMEVTNVLYHLIITNGLLEKGSSANSVLHNLLDTDVKFSEARCSKVLPLAIATYQENLPTHYTKEYHEGKVAHALSVFGVHARGPLVDNYVTQLEHDCERHWKSGRQMCEVLSLTGNPCTKPLHTGGSGEPSIHEADSSSKAELPVMEHCSGVRYISACDCGRKQGSREDPFTVRTANYDFYQLLGTECGCDLLDRINFPVFQPSTKDYKAAQLFSDSSRGINRKDSHSVTMKDFSNQHGNTQGLSLAYVSVHSGDGDSDLMIGGTNLNADAATAHPRISDISLTENSHHIVIQVSDADVESSKEKFLVRQPSTTEYLPGMLHTESPGTLLPQFPSWSLVCLGPSSLYSHNLGLQEQQQAGLLIGSAYLLPWDVTVRLEQQQKDKFWPAVGDPSRSKQSQSMGLSKGRKSKGTKDLSEFNVKIFVGVEYECPRGHRFMCSAPDKVLKTSGTGLVKDNGNKVTGCDMPLYFPCPCMSTKPLIAQLMRVHVVTPKAPVHVTLNPKVQPAPSPCPVFVTGCQEPMRLSQSAYWVLRLPYVYVGDRGPYLPPKDPVPSDYGRLLAGMYGIVEISDSKL